MRCMEQKLYTQEKFAEYRESERLGLLEVDNGNPVERLQHLEARRTHLLRALELRKEMGFPTFVEVGWTGDPGSTMQIDRLSDGLASVDEEIAYMRRS
jgi:hypothetical protein